MFGIHLQPCSSKCFCWHFCYALWNDLELNLLPFCLQKSDIDAPTANTVPNTSSKSPEGENPPAVQTPGSPAKQMFNSSKSGSPQGDNDQTFNDTPVCATKHKKFTVTKVDESALSHPVPAKQTSTDTNASGDETAASASTGPVASESQTGMRDRSGSTPTREKVALDFSVEARDRSMSTSRQASEEPAQTQGMGDRTRSESQFSEASSGLTSQESTTSKMRNRGDPHMDFENLKHKLNQLTYKKDKEFVYKEGAEGKVSAPNSVPPSVPSTPQMQVAPSLPQVVNQAPPPTPVKKEEDGTAPTVHPNIPTSTQSFSQVPPHTTVAPSSGAGQQPQVTVVSSPSQTKPHTTHNPTVAPSQAQPLPTLVSTSAVHTSSQPRVQQPVIPGTPTVNHVGPARQQTQPPPQLAPLNQLPQPQQSQIMQGTHPQTANQHPVLQQPVVHATPQSGMIQVGPGPQQGTNQIQGAGQVVVGAAVVPSGQVLPNQLAQYPAQMPLNPFVHNSLLAQQYQQYQQQLNSQLMAQNMAMMNPMFYHQLNQLMPGLASGMIPPQTVNPATAQNYQMMMQAMNYQQAMAAAAGFPQAGVVPSSPKKLDPQQFDSYVHTGQMQIPTSPQNTVTGYHNTPIKPQAFVHPLSSVGNDMSATRSAKKVERPPDLVNLEQALIEKLHGPTRRGLQFVGPHSAMMQPSLIHTGHNLASPTVPIGAHLPAHPVSPIIPAMVAPSPVVGDCLATNSQQLASASSTQPIGAVMPAASSSQESSTMSGESLVVKDTPVSKRRMLSGDSSTTSDCGTTVPTPLGATPLNMTAGKNQGKTVTKKRSRFSVLKVEDDPYKEQLKEVPKELESSSANGISDSSKSEVPREGQLTKSESDAKITDQAVPTASSPEITLESKAPIGTSPKLSSVKQPQKKIRFQVTRVAETTLSGASSTTSIGPGSRESSLPPTGVKGDEHMKPVTFYLATQSPDNTLTSQAAVAGLTHDGGLPTSSANSAGNMASQVKPSILENVKNIKQDVVDSAIAATTSHIAASMTLNPTTLNSDIMTSVAQVTGSLIQPSSKICDIVPTPSVSTDDLSDVTTVRSLCSTFFCLICLYVQFQKYGHVCVVSSFSLFLYMYILILTYLT